MLAGILQRAAGNNTGLSAAHLKGDAVLPDCEAGRCLCLLQLVGACDQILSFFAILAAIILQITITVCGYTCYIFYILSGAHILLINSKLCTDQAALVGLCNAGCQVGCLLAQVHKAVDHTVGDCRLCTAELRCISRLRCIVVIGDHVGAVGAGSCRTVYIFAVDLCLHSAVGDLFAVYRVHGKILPYTCLCTVIGRLCRQGDVCISGHIVFGHILPFFATCSLCICTCSLYLFLKLKGSCEVSVCILLGIVFVLPDLGYGI